MKVLFVSWICLTSLTFALFARESLAQSKCPRPWIFFDLGNTVLKTVPAPEGADFAFSQITYMPEAVAYLSSLRRQGYKLGLISNVPDTWGPELDRKFLRMIIEVEGVFRGPEHMNWDYFREGGVFLPANDAERKPAPVLFLKARARANAENCAVVYMSNKPAELEIAGKTGFIPYQTHRPGLPPYMPEETLKSLAPLNKP